MKKIFTIFSLTLILLLGVHTKTKAQSTLTTGDIAFVMLNLDASPMTWSWVPLVDISSGTVIYFTDNGWNGYTGAFVYDQATLAINNDDLLTFTATSTIPKGTVITFNGTTFSPSYGTLSWAGVAFPSSTSGDQMLAYQGTFASPTFIAGVHSDYNSSIYDATTKWANNNENTSYIGLSYSSLPPGLTNGTTAVSLFPGITESDNAKYNGSTTSGTKAELLAAINNYSNWSNDNTTPYTWSGNFTVEASFVAPTVTTQIVSSIATTAATGNGNVTSTGGANITERGIYYSTINGFTNGTGTKVSTTGNWSNTGAFTQAITGLTAGTTYYVKAFATNSAGTSYGAQVNFTTLAALSATTSQSNVSCNGGSNGSASVMASGGQAPYSYSWSPSGGASATATGLAAGFYTCTITDALNNSIVKNFTIIQPTAINAATGSQTNVSCNGGSNGAALVSPSGGQAPYTYSWSPSGGTSAIATGLSAGTYTVTIMDANTCQTTRSFIITQPAAISLTAFSQTNIACNGGANGAASVSPATGGAGGYSYNWTPGNPTGDGTTSITGLPAGTWTCTVTDANACTASKSFTITQPTALNLSTASQTDVSCYGGSNGAASVSPATGGAGGYTYNWTPGNPTGDGTTSVTGLAAGTWTCTVTDANSCTASKNFTVTEPPVLSLTTASQTDVSVAGGSDGVASVNAATGGAGGYTYNWTPGNPIGDGTTSVTGLAAGTWTCTVTDANTCTVSQNFTILEPPTVTTASISTFDGTSATMGGEVTATGGATVTERGVVYSTTDNTPTIAEGATKVIIGSGTGSFSQSVESLTRGTTYYLRAFATNTVGTSYGNDVIFTTKATPIITWDNPADITYGTVLSATQLNATANTAGTFTYTPLLGTKLNAGNGQTLQVDFTPTDLTNFEATSKTVSINVAKATPVITWSNPEDINNETALSSIQLNAVADVEGIFTYTPAIGVKLNVGDVQDLKVDFEPTDAVNYESASKTVYINVFLGTSMSEVSNNQLLIFPNPVIDYFSVSEIEGRAKITLSDLNGRVILVKEISNNEMISLSSFSSGMYLITLEDINGFTSRKILKK